MKRTSLENQYIRRFGHSAQNLKCHSFDMYNLFLK